MAEYIDKEKTVKVLRDLGTRSRGVFGVIICSTANAIEKIPAADVQPVVFCKDCNLFDFANIKEDENKK